MPVAAGPPRLLASARSALLSENSTSTSGLSLVDHCVATMRATLEAPAVLGGSPVDRSYVGHAVDGGHDVGVRGPAVPKEDAFQPAASHVAIGIAVGLFDKQLLQDTLSEAQQQLSKATACVHPIRVRGR